MIKLTEKQTKKWKEHAISCYPEEACAIVSNGRVIVVENISDNKESSFKIKPSDIEKYTPSGILHTHIHKHHTHSIDFKTPSLLDIQTQIKMDIPWGISVTDDENCSDISWFPESRDVPLEGRRFMFYISDCYTLLRDYYHQKLDIELPYYPEDIDFLDIPDNAYYENIEKFGFYEIPLEDLREHDILIMSFKRKCDHSAIYLGNNEALNHFVNGLSRKVTTGKLGSWIEKAARWKGFKDET